ncbi:antibiotic biosynthesis monooxygenase family protein [Micromonospora sp. URMC 103]|uniref:antibiotic biosynthesis monooxygenase family protein n=1 Tax=Micromonospora sp. URMC 103 TaxID=3423406 RepID=UPI003F19A965
MIARTWRGWASPAAADEYQRHYETEVAAHLQQVPGFRGARLLRRNDGDEVAFTSITFFSSMDDVRAFAGDDPEQAVIEENARRALSRWDERVTHHHVAADLAPGPAAIPRSCRGGSSSVVE